MDISLQGFYTWIQQQAEYGLFIVLVGVAIYCAAKRAWIALIGAIVGLAGVGIFIINPNAIETVAEGLGKLLNIK